MILSKIKDSAELIEDMTKMVMDQTVLSGMYLNTRPIEGPFTILKLACLCAGPRGRNASMCDKCKKQQTT